MSSEARILANRANSLKSTGPVSQQGKNISRKNSLKHGMAGAGVVLPDDVAAEVERLDEEFQAELNPRSGLGKALVRQLATTSARMQRGEAQESAALATRVRHAADDFDEQRIDRAEQLFDALGDDPRGNLRRLRKSPEGVDRLIAEWQELRADLTRESKPCWVASHLDRAAHLTGLRTEDARWSRLGALSRGFWGDFSALGDHEGAGLEEVARKGWARQRLVERIDAEVAGLEAHRETLDFEMIEQDRAEAGDRALFDPSKEATLARRYELEAQRGFFRALKELRKVEAEHAARPEPSRRPAPATPLEASLASSREASLASFREETAKSLKALDELLSEAPKPAPAAFRAPRPPESPSFGTATGRDGQVVSICRGPVRPG